MNDPVDQFTEIPSDAPWFIKWVWDNRKVISKEISTWCMGAIGVLSIVAEQGPYFVPSIAPYVSGTTVHWITGILALVGIIDKMYGKFNGSKV